MKNNLFNKLNIFKNIFHIAFDYSNKKLVYLFMFFSIFNSFAEIFSIGILFPLIDILVNSNRFLENEKFFLVVEFFDVNEENYDNFFLLSFTIAIIFAYLSKIISIVLLSKITHELGYKLSNKIFSKTIYKDYIYHIKSNSSIFLGNLEKVENTRGVVFSLFDLIKSTILIFSVASFLIIIDPKIVISLFIILAAIYVFLVKTFKSRLSNYGNLNAELVNQRFKALQESTANMKDVIIRNVYEILITNFEKILFKIKNIRFKSDLINNIPQQIILLTASLVLILLIFIFSNSQQGLLYYLSLITGILLGIQRILPSFQNLFSIWVSIKIYYPSVQDVYKIIYSEKSNAEINYENKNNQKIIFENSLKLKNLEFSYDQKKKIFSDTNIEFKKGFSYGIVGNSGTGKSTLIDLIIGILKCDKGKILVDDKEITGLNLKSWQEKISYVPQEPIMLDTSVNENIIFNHITLENEEDRINRVTKLSEAYDFIQKLEKKFKTIVGEKGSRISGGQKQRLAISRALYKDFDILIMDESTNSIDYEIEDKIYDNILSQYNDKLILIISHRKSIYKKLDHLIEIKNGKIELIK